jgi:hypothetical protein
MICKHGAEECAGNVQQLCIAKYAPRGQWWNFVQCQNFGGKGAIGKPDLALRCAQAAQIDWNASGAGQCAGEDGSGTGDEGVHLLHESAELAHDLRIMQVHRSFATFLFAHFNYSKSCTILINSRKVCVHDGTWKECEVSFSVLT